MIKDPFGDITGGMAPPYIGDETDEKKLVETPSESESESPKFSVPSISHSTSSENLPVPSAILSVQPMTVQDIFGHIVTLYSEHGGVLIKSMTILNLPVIVGSLVIVGLAMFPVGMMATPILQLFLYPLQAIGAAGAAAVIAKVVSDSYLGKEVDLWESLDFLWQKAGTVFSAAFSAWLAVTLMTFGISLLAGITAAGTVLFAGMIGLDLLGKLGMVLIIISAVTVILLSSFAMLFSPAVAIIEDKAWFAAPRRSIELVTKSPYAAARVLGIAFLVWLAVWLIGLGVTIPVAAASHLLATATGITMLSVLGNSLLGLASTVFLGPAAAAAAVLLYYDQKIRYENFSLDELRKTKQLL